MNNLPLGVVQDRCGAVNAIDQIILGFRLVRQGLGPVTRQGGRHGLFRLAKLVGLAKAWLAFAKRALAILGKWTDWFLGGNAHGPL